MAALVLINWLNRAARVFVLTMTLVLTTSLIVLEKVVVGFFLFVCLTRYHL